MSKANLLKNNPLPINVLTENITSYNVYRKNIHENYCSKLIHLKHKKIANRYVRQLTILTILIDYSQAPPRYAL